MITFFFITIGKDCIEFEGSFYSPPEFEKLAGKDSCRKWKSSIYHKKAPLHFWFKVLFFFFAFL